MIIYYLLTERCNLKCGHCIRGNAKDIDMGFADAVLGLKKIYNHYGNDTMLVISGGEPTLHSDFALIVREASRLFRRVFVNTNGTGDFFDDLEDLIKSKKLVIQFSLDGDEKYHDKLRGQGVYQSVLEKMDRLASYGIPLWISTVVSTENIDSVKAMVDVLKQYHMEKWHINPIVPAGRAIKTLSVEMWNTFVDDIIKITPFRLGIKKLFYFKRLDKLSDEDILKLASSERNRELRNCGCVRNKIYIYPNFDVYPCTCLRDMCMGNLILNTMPDILNSACAKKILNLYVSPDSVCYKCRYKELCNGGCLGMAKRTSGELNSGDGRCPLVRQSCMNIG